MKKTYLKLIVFLFLVSLGISLKPVLAVQGELNYDFSQPQTQTVVEDTSKLNECNQKKSETEMLLKNCQKTRLLSNEAQQKLTSQKNTFMWLALINGALAIGLGVLTLILVFKRKKNPPTKQILN